MAMLFLSMNVGIDIDVPILIILIPYNSTFALILFKKIFLLI